MSKIFNAVTNTTIGASLIAGGALVAVFSAAAGGSIVFPAIIATAAIVLGGYMVKNSVQSVLSSAPNETTGPAVPPAPEI